MLKQVSRKKLENVLSKVSIQTQEIGWRLVKLLVAVKAVKDIEEILAGVAKSRPWWTNLLEAVDSRVEKALAILRPQCLIDYRILITSLGWPPSLSTTKLQKDNCMVMQQSFFLMQGEEKSRFSQSFSALCSLQQLQAMRDERASLLQRNQSAFNSSDSKDMGEVFSFFKHGLWPIDELVNLVALRMEYHFNRWFDQPHFIFALVHKTTQNFLDGVENNLQPLIDHARLLGCSAKEAWAIAMVRNLLGYFERQLFPVLVKDLYNKDADSEVSSSLLHVVDLMITFDKRMKILSTLGTHVTEAFASIEGLSIMSIFNERSDWLQIWAEMEVNDAEGKLKPMLEEERSWLEGFRNQGHSYEKEETFLLLSREDYKAPLMADSVLRLGWEMIERGLALPCAQRRKQFISSSANLFLSNFFNLLFERSRNFEFMDVSEDSQLLRVCSAINTACYCEHVLHYWSEDVNLNEMFEDEIMFLVKLQTDCLEVIATSLLLHFDDLCWNYVQDRKQWEIKQVDSDPDEDHLCISSGFIEALDMLQARIWFLNLNLNSHKFLDLWRSIAGGLDHFIFTSVPMSNARFSSLGVYRFRNDMKALFLIFKLFCARPEAFFPCTSNCLKLLEMNKKDAEQMLEVLSQRDMKPGECLRLQGLFHVSPAQSETILRNRIFGG
ncbi:RINT1-like protein MAG2L isoform X2 [Phalaenopsis equestris]|nr:RINT1-like protein MAG2L isoform X2 [Phalaenopsis equestris]